MKGSGPEAVLTVADLVEVTAILVKVMGALAASHGAVVNMLDEDRASAIEAVRKASEVFAEASTLVEQLLAKLGGHLG